MFDISYYARNITYDSMWNLTPLERDVIVDRLQQKFEDQKKRNEAKVHH